MTDHAAGDYLKASGFRLKRMTTKTSGYKLSKRELVEVAWNFVADLRRARVWLTVPQLICSMDFTLTSHRNDQLMSFGMVGAENPELGKGLSPYTNCILTCIWPDGVNRTPCIMWTFNPEFRVDRKPTKRRKILTDRFSELRDHFNVDLARCRWLVNPDKKYFVAEGPDLVRAFCKHYNLGANMIVFSDGGNAFKEEDVDIFVDMGFAAHYTYPSPVHQFLSPNDNDIHGVAKVPWRLNVLDFADDVDATLCLMNYLDDAMVRHGERCFKRNMMELKKEDVEQLVSRGRKVDSAFSVECLREFRVFRGEDAREPKLNIPKELQTTLDGRFYDKNL